MIAAAIVFLLIVTSSAEGSPRTVKATICEVFGPRCGPALRVAHCETGGTFNPRARGRAGERGLFQIHPVHFGWLDETRLWLPGYNARSPTGSRGAAVTGAHGSCRPLSQRPRLRAACR